VLVYIVVGQLNPNNIPKVDKTMALVCAILDFIFFGVCVALLYVHMCTFITLSQGGNNDHRVFVKQSWVCGGGDPATGNPLCGVAVVYHMGLVHIEE
jgi:hypothetical protein